MEETAISGYLISLATRSYQGIKVGLDCANGSSWMIAKSVFDALGAKTYVINNEPDGTNINMNCGSTAYRWPAEVVNEPSIWMSVLPLTATRTAVSPWMRREMW